MIKKIRPYHIWDACRHAILVLACLLCFSQSALSSDLGDFEQDATTDETDKKTGDNDYYNDSDHGFLDSFFYAVFDFALVGGGETSWQRVKWTQEEDFVSLKPRQPGEALIPFFRFDSEYQNATGDVYAYDFRVEGGYGPIGLQVRDTHYEEKDPPDKLDYLQIYGLYRMSLGNYVEIDFGLGASTLKGEEHNSGGSFTMPILVHPNRFIGIELRPAWTYINGRYLDDWDLGMDFDYRYAALRIGYRWVHSEHEGLDGPYVGISFRI
jgi:hypothetical protein